MNHEHDKNQRATPVDSGSEALAEALHSSFGIVKFVMAAMFALFLLSGFFKVEPQEKAIILRFGKPVGEGDRALLLSGLHWSWPYPIDEVIKIPSTSIQQVHSRGSWFAQTPEQEKLNQEPPPGPTLNPAVDGYALTADGNIVHSKATLSYRIDDAIRCVFDFAAGNETTFSLAGVSNAVLHALDNAIVSSAARFRMDELLLNDAVGFQDAVRRHVTETIAAQRLGIIVDSCVVQSREPRQLKQAFANVTTAGQNRGKLLNDAHSYENQVLSKASADATNHINTAESDSNRLVQAMRSDKDNFLKLRPKYEANPRLFVEQRLIETMGRVFTNAAEKKFLPSTPDGQPTELRLLLGRELPKANTEQPAQP